MNESDYRDWVTKAESDFDLAKRALRGKVKHTDAAAFHAQQCAEKYFKALFIAHQVDFPKTRDLVILNYLHLQNKIITAFEERKLDFLSSFSVQVRYPGEDPSIDEAQQAIEIAKTVRKFARKWLQIGG